MVRTTVVLVALVAGTAHAQAPGQVPAPSPTVMAHRWAIGVELGMESLTPKTDGAPHVGFATLELSGRFRIRSDIEVALTLGGGGALKGEFSASEIYADFRYRFMAEQPWNVFAFAGLGVAAAYAKTNAPDVERKARGSLRLGGGVERRFAGFAVTAELRVFGIADNKDVPVLVPPTTSYELAHDGVSGAGLVVGASYYF